MKQKMPELFDVQNIFKGCFNEYFIGFRFMFQCPMQMIVKIWRKALQAKISHFRSLLAG